MITALLLIFDTGKAWDRVALSRRGLFFIVAFYLLPMMALVSAVEGYGLVAKGQSSTVNKFTRGEAAFAEVIEMLLMCIVIAVCAYTIKALSETFRGGHTYTQAFKVVIYGLSPLFLLRLLDAMPNMSVWIPWAVGIVLCLNILYTGVPRVMQPDPPHAFGLFVMSALLMVVLTGLERFLTAGYLAGHFKPVGVVVAHISSLIVSKLEFWK